MFARKTFVAVVTMVFLSVGWASAQVIDLDAEPTEKKKPEIWEKASPAGTKRAEEAARKDACLRLVEAVYRLPVSGNRDVLDMMIKNRQVDADLIKGLLKAPAVNAEYLEDGSVRMTVATTPAEVVKVLKSAYARVDWDLAEEDHVIAAVASRTKAGTQILAVGEGALAGSVGETRLPVRRAALSKAVRAIGVQIAKLVLREHDYDGHQDERRWMQDFAIAFKQVPTKIALGLSTVRIHSEEWNEDGSIKMRAELDVIVVSQLVHRAQGLYDRRGRFARWGFSTLLSSTKDMIFHAEVTASSEDRVPKNTPLALEIETFDAALKVPIKDK